MKLDTSGVAPAQLMQSVNSEYGLRIVAIEFQPKGEASYSYIGRDAAGRSHLIKVQESARAVDLEARLRAVDYLRAERGLAPVLAPYRGRQGAYTLPLGRYVVSVFPYVESASGYETALSPEQLLEVAELLAEIHRSEEPPFEAPRERFDNPFEAPILRALEAARSAAPPASEHQRRVRELLLREEADVRRTLGIMRRLGDHARALRLDWVVTHGDPNLANILVDGAGGLHFIDWDELALGPPERDLMFFADEREGRWERFLRRYAETYGRLELHAELFEFYEYRWAVQEIADYTGRLLFKETVPEEDEHAWTELQPYLPTQHDDIRASVERTIQGAHRVLEQ